MTAVTNARLLSATIWIQSIAEDLSVHWKARTAAGEIIAALNGEYSDPPDMALEWLDEQTKRRGDPIHKDWAICVRDTLAEFDAQEERKTVETEPYWAPESGEVSCV